MNNLIAKFVVTSFALDKLRKIGWLGLIITMAISALLHFTGLLSARLTLPFVFPFAVMLLISYNNKRNK